MTDDFRRQALTVEGRIQGVGFRPFVWRLAQALGLSGTVRNCPAGVRMELQGEESRLIQFRERLFSEKPPLAEITACHVEKLATKPDEKDFTIVQSDEHGGQKVLVSPDVGACQECLADTRDPLNPRFGYAFTNCVNCGPRYSITSKIPYDRPGTVMACFPLCENCSKEYSSPENRRFHAQPIACPKCGPRLWFTEKSSTDTLGHGQDSGDALKKTASFLRDGKIIALKGLGGFQLCCDAANGEAVKRLRKAKQRPEKAFALMAANLEKARRICSVNEEQARLLESPARPIVLCKALPGAPLPPEIAPDSDELGIMLPSTPLHSLLFDQLETQSNAPPALVMTSGNRPDEPICLGNREALGKLDGIADGWLLHNRDILVRVDDSVAIAKSRQDALPRQLVRRARGYVPEPVRLPPAKDRRSILGAGALLKATFCLTRDDCAFVSQHLGDLQSAPVLDFYCEALAHLQKLLECRPRAIVHDLHPDFSSTRFARELAEKEGLPAIALQHHAAHAASVLAENSQYAPALALCLDGTGLGPDGTIWGGELLYMNLNIPEWRRLGSFSPFYLPGGERAIKEPWRIAAALDPAWEVSPSLKREAGIVQAMLKGGVGLSVTSSCGRLFDALAARLGLCARTSYEGQAAMLLMRAANRASPTPLPEEARLLHKNGLWLIDSKRLFMDCAKIHEQAGAEQAAFVFQGLLAKSLAEMCANAAELAGTSFVGLSGGVFQNRSFTAMLKDQLEGLGLTPLFHRQLPAGDGGLSLGQAVWGRQLANNGQLS